MPPQLKTRYPHKSVLVELKLDPFSHENIGLERVREALESLSLNADTAEVFSFEKTFGTDKAMAGKKTV